MRSLSHHHSQGINAGTCARHIGSGWPKSRSANVPATMMARSKVKACEIFRLDQSPGAFSSAIRQWWACMSSEIINRASNSFLHAHGSRHLPQRLLLKLSLELRLAPTVAVWLRRDCQRRMQRMPTPPSFTSGVQLLCLAKTFGCTARSLQR
jgi:hypothetical protein